MTLQVLDVTSSIPDSDDDVFFCIICIEHVPVGALHIVGEGEKQLWRATFAWFQDTTKICVQCASLMENHCGTVIRQQFADNASRAAPASPFEAISDDKDTWIDFLLESPLSPPTSNNNSTVSSRPSRPSLPASTSSSSSSSTFWVLSNMP